MSLPEWQYDLERPLKPLLYKGYQIELTKIKDPVGYYKNAIYSIVVYKNGKIVYSREEEPDRNFAISDAKMWIKKEVNRHKATDIREEIEEAKRDME